MDIEKQISKAVGEHVVHTTCPNCGAPISYKLNQVGTTIACPGCKVLIQLEKG